MTPLAKAALAIWQAGVQAVQADSLVRNCCGLDEHHLRLGETRIPLADVDRLIVVGAGKAGAGMAAGLEQALGPSGLQTLRVQGWVNVPENCVRPLAKIRLHGSRPAGVNEPTQQGVDGTRAMLQLVEQAGPRDVCVCLLSGGGSALMPAPVPGITLADKLAVTRHLSAAGANIVELNTVRRQLSLVKGGGLLRACRAGRLVTLVISDVLGDDLQTIASGPTVPGTTTAADAQAVLDKYAAKEAGISARLLAALADQSNRPKPGQLPRSHVQIIANNATAVMAASDEALRQGFAYAMHAATAPEGPAEEVGRHLAQMAQGMLATPGTDCLITGGEPTVKLADAKIRGRGGRNQQLVLAAMQQMAGCDWSRLALLSGGTDGEDGPTDAAGAWCDANVQAAWQSQGLDLQDYLARNDAYRFFEQAGGLLKTGPTHTNVCDLRVVVVRRPGPLVDGPTDLARETK